MNVPDDDVIEDSENPRKAPPDEPRTSGGEAGDTRDDIPPPNRENNRVG